MQRKEGDLFLTGTDFLVPSKSFCVQTRMAAQAYFLQEQVACIRSHLTEYQFHRGEDEAHPLASLMDIVGTLIEKYENEYVPELQNEKILI